MFLKIRQRFKFSLDFTDYLGVILLLRRSKAFKELGRNPDAPKTGVKQYQALGHQCLVPLFRE